VTKADQASALDVNARYGRSPSAAKRTRWIAIGTAIAFVVVFAAWVIWGGLFSPAAELETSDTGHVIVDQHEVGVTFELSVPTGRTSSCAIQALNESYTIVGWKIVPVPASDIRTRTFTESVRTTELAVTGLIYRCWLT
jgi:hypothetical protein